MGIEGAWSCERPGPEGPERKQFVMTQPIDAGVLLKIPRKPKDDKLVKYRRADGEQSCATCRFFIPGYSACSVVEGWIDGDGVSDFYEARGSQQKRDEEDTMEEIFDAGAEVDALAQKFTDQLGLSYSDALRKVARDRPDLWRRYSQGGDEAGQVHKSTGGANMNTEKVPLSAESVVDVRAQERMAKGEIKDYSQAVKAVLDADPHLALCYNRGLPYLEASAYQDEMPNVPAKAQLGVLISGARKSDNSPDVELMIQIANLTPALVRSAAGETLTDIANQIIRSKGSGGSGMESERFPQALAEARSQHPELVSASESGRMNEGALRTIYFGWFAAND